MEEKDPKDDMSEAEVMPSLNEWVSFLLMGGINLLMGCINVFIICISDSSM